MKRAFGDSFFFIALLNPRDNYHQRTVALSFSFQLFTFLMSDDVIISVEKLGKKYRIQHQAEQRRYAPCSLLIALCPLPFALGP